MKVRTTCMFLLVAILSVAADANTARPAKIFANHMVLQQGMQVPVWGRAKANESVTLQFAGQTVTTKADESGRWELKLKPMTANATGRDLTVQSGSHRHTISDVVVGEVWFAGGQSNMAYTAGAMAKRLPEGRAIVDAAKYPSIRFRKINERNASTPQQDFSRDAEWSVCTPQNAGRFSAVSFVFARRIHLERDVPVGVIDCSWGGTPIEPYIPADAFVGHPTLVKLAALAKKNDVEAIRAMPGGTFVRSPAWLAGAIYNGRIAPVAPYAIRGAIWYQGESNCGRGEDPRDYAHKMRALIKGWRSVWQRKDLPVLDRKSVV